MERRAASVLTIALAGALVSTLRQGATIDADALRVLTVREVLRIGNANDPSGGFSAILAVDVDRDGQLYVYDSKDKHIKVFATSGRPAPAPIALRPMAQRKAPAIGLNQD